MSTLSGWKVLPRWDTECYEKFLATPDDEHLKSIYDSMNLATRVPSPDGWLAARLQRKDRSVK